MFDKKTFGSRLRELRRQKNISQAALGQMLGITSTQVGDMERGNSTTSMPRLYVLCQYFEVSSDYLMGLADDPMPYPRCGSK